MFAAKAARCNSSGPLVFGGSVLVQGYLRLEPDLVRPLLDRPKSEIEKFARENKIHFREDASNRSLDFLRNRIRRELDWVQIRNGVPNGL